MVYGPDDKAFVITISLHPGESFSYTMQMSPNASIARFGDAPLCAI